MDTIDLSEPHGRLFLTLQLAAHRLRKVANRKVTAHAGVTATQATILYIIATRETIMQKEIAALLGQNESAVAAMIVRLEKLGLVDRRRREDDARASSLGLTQAGQRQLAATKPAFHYLDTILDGALSVEDLDSLNVLLARIAEAFSDDPP